MKKLFFYPEKVYLPFRLGKKKLAFFYYNFSLGKGNKKI